MCECIPRAVDPKERPARSARPAPPRGRANVRFRLGNARLQSSPPVFAPPRGDWRVFLALAESHCDRRRGAARKVREKAGAARWPGNGWPRARGSLARLQIAVLDERFGPRLRPHARHLAGEGRRRKGIADAAASSRRRRGRVTLTRRAQHAARGCGGRLEGCGAAADPAARSPGLEGRRGCPRGGESRDAACAWMRGRLRLGFATCAALFGFRPLFLRPARFTRRELSTGPLRPGAPRAAGEAPLSGRDASPRCVSGRGEQLGGDGCARAAAGGNGSMGAGRRLWSRRRKGRGLGRAARRGGERDGAARRELELQGSARVPAASPSRDRSLQIGRRLTLFAPDGKAPGASRGPLAPPATAKTPCEPTA